ncbi:hypothetical protein CRYUN_Cryun07bG0073000 [Craigia yunnanensis]
MEFATLILKIFQMIDSGCDLIVHKFDSDHFISFCLGAKKDGSSITSFIKQLMLSYWSTKARKIQNQHNANEEHVRWHKAGKTKPVIENGVQKGWKKIMVLYKNSKRGCKPEKSNWVMHQYHLGDEEEEHDGEYVVSKISYQHKNRTDKNDDSPTLQG